MNWILIVLQICFLTLFALLGNGISQLFNIPFPGSIIGMILLFVGLKIKLIKLQWVEKGSQFLLGHMLLFFVPPVVGVVDHTDLLKMKGIEVILVILISTLLVMVTTGLTTEWMTKKRGATND